MIYRTIRPMLLAMGILAVPKPAAAVELGPYPLEIATPAPQDIDLSWFDPSKVVKRVEDANGKSVQLKRAVLKETGGDVIKAAEALVQHVKEANGAQALFDLMADAATLVPGISTPGGSGAVDLATKEPGIRVAARVADVLKGRYGTKEMGHFDQPLIERAILLMAFHGAPDVPGMKKVPLSNGKGEVPPIDPVVRIVLRGMLKAGDLPQILAARALGQLGDAGTAKEIIDHPSRFPGASIADFGPDAVEAFKQKRLKELARGVEGYDNFIQGMRLTPKYQETAIDLALAGDAGGGMAAQRNYAIYIASVHDKDALFASYLDQCFRFPNTRMAAKASLALSNWDVVAEWGWRWSKTHEMLLRILDHDLEIVFNKKDWRTTDLKGKIYGISDIVAFWHEAKYQKHIRQLPGITDERDIEHFISFCGSIEKLFRKHYKPIIYPHHPTDWTTLNYHERYPGTFTLNLYARHLGLPNIVDPLPLPPKEEARKDFVVKMWQADRDKDPMDGEEKRSALGLGADDRWICIKLGHVREGERL